MDGPTKLTSSSRRHSMVNTRPARGLSAQQILARLLPPGTPTVTALERCGALRRMVLRLCSHTAYGRTNPDERYDIKADRRVLIEAGIGWEEFLAIHDQVVAGDYRLCTRLLVSLRCQRRLLDYVRARQGSAGGELVRT